MASSRRHFWEVRVSPDTLLNLIFGLAVAVGLYVVAVNFYLLDSIPRRVALDRDRLEALLEEDVINAGGFPSPVAPGSRREETGSGAALIAGIAPPPSSLSPPAGSMVLSGDGEFNLTELTPNLPPSPELPGLVIEDGSLKTILFWNPFFEDWMYHFGFGHQPFLDHKCPVSNCQTTTDRSWLARAEAVVFHTPFNVEPLPEMRLPHQKYVFVQREPHLAASKKLMNNFHDIFNLTMTYRRDSDIPIPYGMVVPRANGSQPAYYTDRGPNSKQKDVVWMVSHCHSFGKREWYVEELQLYIGVDIWGLCGNYSCDKHETLSCYHQFEADYKFYLAFENTYCTDYVSEKMWRLFLYDLVPIVYGKADYRSMVPDKAVIDIQDYPNPKDLAEYLQYLGRNQTAYLEYFKWKEHYEVIQSRDDMFGRSFCRMCEILHDPGYVYQSYNNITSWWMDDTCQITFMRKLRKVGNW